MSKIPTYLWKIFLKNLYFTLKIYIFNIFIKNGLKLNKNDNFKTIILTKKILHLKFKKFRKNNFINKFNKFKI